MLLDKIKNDNLFIAKCAEFGALGNKAMLVEDIIVVPTVKPGIYIFMNTNYEVIEVHNQRFNMNNEEIVETARKYKSRYEYKEPEYSITFPYPFETFSMKDIYDLGRMIRVDLSYTSLPILKVNGVVVSKDTSDLYSYVLYYLKYIYDTIQEYAKYAYKAAMMSYSHPTIENYTYRLLETINDTIVKMASEGKSISPYDIIASIGNVGSDIRDYYEVIYGIDLISEQKGYKYDPFGNQKFRQVPKYTKDVNAEELLVLKDGDFEPNTDLNMYIKAKTTEKSMELAREYITDAKSL